ncbi:MAG: hypothetical protein ACI4WM_07555 [Erysipelotrichaceae bacterium]
MKKSNFVALILGLITVVFFGLGMCMVMVEEWNAFKPGIVLGVIGLVFLIITIIVYRKMENKAPIKINGKTVLTAAIAIVGALVLGLGMCFCMVWGFYVKGIIIALAGAVILICLIPLCKGLK